MVKATNLMYSVIIALGVFAMFFTFISPLLINSGVAIPDKHNQTFQAMRDFSEVEDETQSIRDTAGFGGNETSTSTSLIQRVTGIDIDIVGTYFESGLKIITLVPNTLNILSSIITSGFGSLSSIPGMPIKELKFMVLGILAVAVILGIIVSAYLRKDI